MSNKKLESCMKSFQNGDLDGFNRIYESTNRMVFYLIYSIVKDYQLAEDLLQNVYITVYEKKDYYHPSGSVKAWIMQIARNLAINAYNRKQREIIVDNETFDGLDTTTSNTERPLIDLAQELLAEDEFLIVMLCVTEGYTRKEVGKLLHLSTSGVTWKLNQALEKLRKAVKGGERNE